MINQGLNTWGWEDTFGRGDHDYNDLTVQLDFTSATVKGGWSEPRRSVGGPRGSIVTLPTEEHERIQVRQY